MNDTVRQTSRLALPEATTTVDVQTASAEVDEAQPTSIEEETSLESAAKKTRKPRTPRSGAKQFDAAKLLPDFRGQSLQTAVQIVLAQEPDRTFGTDEVLSQVYGEFSEAELTKGRRSLGKVLSNGAKEGLWQRTQEKPPLYQAPVDASSSSTEDE